MREDIYRFGQLLLTILIILMFFPTWEWSEQKETVRILTHGYDSTMAMYQAGKLTSLDVLKAQVDLINSRGGISIISPITRPLWPNCVR